MATLAAVTNMPALALLGEEGRLMQSTEPFRRWYKDKEGVCRHSPELQRVLDGQANAAVVKLDGIAVDIAAVSDRGGARHVLLTLPTDELPTLGDAGGALLDGALDESPAIVWLKDLEGRYVRANSRFTTFLGTTEERLLGRTDAELPPAETVDGPRLQERDEDIEEPLRLEYVVGPYQGRDALVVLRFPVGDANGVPTLVCGVASPSSEANVARSEAAWLLRIERWSRLDAESIRAEMLAEWGVLPDARGRSAPASTSAEPGSGTPDREQQAAIAEARAERATAVAERDAALSASEELAAELKAAKVRLTELGWKIADGDVERRDAEVALAAHAADLERALGRERERAEELERTLTLVRERLGDDAQAARTEVKRARADADAARTEVERARADADGAHADLEKARAEAQDARAAAAAERDSASQATAALEQERKQVAALQEGAAVAEGRIRELTGDVERERVRVAGLAQVRARVQQLEGELRATMARADTAEREVEFAATEAEKADNQLQFAHARVENADGDLRLAVARADKAEGDVEQWRTRALEAETELARGTARAEGLDSELARGHSRVEQLDAELRLATERADAAEREVELGQTRVVELEREVESGRAKAEEADAAIAELEESESDPTPAAAERADLEDGDGDSDPATPAAELARVGEVSDAPRAQTGSGVSWQPTAKRTLAASLARESVWRNVLKETVQVLGAEGGWDTVTAWLPDESDGLGCAATWTAHRGLDRFEALTWEASPKRNGSLLDQALQAPHLTWLTDIDAVDDERLQTAAAHGMSSALLLPVRNGASTIGLLELLTHDSIEPDAQIGLSLEASALQLGRFGHLLSLGQ
jgi:PAS domain S-box-containing protein